MPSIHLHRLRLLHMGAATAAVLTLAACGDKAPEPTSAPAPSAQAPAAPAPAAPAPAPQVNPEAAASAKMNTYIGCFNSANTRAHDAMQRYASWVKDLKSGPTGKEKIVYGVYTVGEHALKECGEAMVKAADAQPAMAELDQAAKAYSATLQTWGTQLQEADKYYDRGDYKDDAFAKAKAMHPELVKSFDAFEKAAKSFSAALDVENDKRQTARLAELEKSEGRKFEYWHLATMMSAKQLVRVVQEDSFDVEVANAKLKAYDEATQGLLAHVKADEKNKPMMWSTMDSQLEELLVAAKQRIRRVRDKVPYRDSDRMQMSANAGWMVEGSPDRVIREYNELIGSSNRLR